MFHVMNEKEIEIMKDAETETDTDYEIKNGRISTDYLFEAIQQLLWKIEDLEEEIETMQEDILENYELKHVDPYEEIGISRNDFI